MAPVACMKLRHSGFKGGIGQSRFHGLFWPVGLFRVNVYDIYMYIYILHQDFGNTSDPNIFMIRLQAQTGCPEKKSHTIERTDKYETQKHNRGQLLEGPWVATSKVMSWSSSCPTHNPTHDYWNPKP